MHIICLCWRHILLFVNVRLMILSGSTRFGHSGSSVQEQHQSDCFVSCFSPQLPPFRIPYHSFPRSTRLHVSHPTLPHIRENCLQTLIYSRYWHPWHTLSLPAIGRLTSWHGLALGTYAVLDAGSLSLLAKNASINLETRYFCIAARQQNTQ